MSKHHALLYRNLASLNESGVDLRKSLRISNCGPERYQKAMQKASDTVAEGGKISDGLKHSPKLFRKTDVDIIEAAELTGTLPFALRLLAAEHETRRKIAQEATGRFTYTIILFHISVLIFHFIYNIQTQGFDFSSLLPRILLTLSILYIPFTAIYLIVTKTPSHGPLRYIIDLIAYTIPGLHGAIQSIALGRFARIINLAYRAGMPEDKSLELATGVTGNSIVASMFNKCKESVLNGNDVSAGFSVLLPKQFTETWKVGEMAGSMEATTEKLAEIYEEDGAFKLKGFCATINFVFYLIMILCIAIGIVLTFVNAYSKVLT